MDFSKLPTENIKISYPMKIEGVTLGTIGSPAITRSSLVRTICYNGLHQKVEEVHQKVNVETSSIWRYNDGLITKLDDGSIKYLLPTGGGHPYYRVQRLVDEQKECDNSCGLLELLNTDDIASDPIHMGILEDLGTLVKIEENDLLTAYHESRFNNRKRTLMIYGPGRLVTPKKVRTGQFIQDGETFEKILTIDCTDYEPYSVRYVYTRKGDELLRESFDYCSVNKKWVKCKRDEERLKLSSPLNYF